MNYIEIEFNENYCWFQIFSVLLHHFCERTLGEVKH